MQKSTYDFNQPDQSMSLANFRNSLRGLFMMDLLPLRPRASVVLDPMEYATQGAAQAQWSGTGVTVDVDGANQQEGSFALECTIDATGNRSVINSGYALNISAFLSAKVWTRVDVASSAITFFIQDGSGNISYWDITTNSTLDTWQQDTLDLSSPDSNNGTDADLTDMAAYGFAGLDASKVYLFDAIQLICGMNVAVFGADAADFYRHIWLSSEAPLDFQTQASPTITAPASNPRIDVLTVDSSGTLAWTEGSEASVPVAPDVPAGKAGICYVYCRTTMTKVLDYEDKDSDTNQGYILADIRPFISPVNDTPVLSGLDASLPATHKADRFYWATDTSKLYWDNGTAWVDITALFPGLVRTTGDQSVAGIKTFSSIPVLPASDPTTDNQAVRKAYVASTFVALTGDQTVAGVKTFSSIPVGPSSDPTSDDQLARKKYVDDKVVPIQRSIQSSWNPSAGASGSTVLVTADAGKRWLLGGDFYINVSTSGAAATQIGFRFTLADDSVVDWSLCSQSNGGSGAIGGGLGYAALLSGSLTTVNADNGLASIGVSLNNTYFKKIELYYIGSAATDINISSYRFSWLEM